MYNLETDKDKYFLLGRIIKTYGYRGGLMMHLDSDQPETYDKIRMIFVNIDQSLVPWFISDISIRGDLATMKLDDIDAPESARNLVGRDVFLPLEQLQSLSDKQFYFHEIIGYSATDETYGYIGIVDRILQRPEQDIISIMNGKREVLIPLTEEMILRVDRKKKILHLKTPEGLIDLYL